MVGPLGADDREELIRACRTSIGDELRSLTYFTIDTYDHLYLRDDLERKSDTATFVERERRGFADQRTDDRSELGAYRYTVRVFEDGYLVRVIAGTHGVYATADPLSVERFDDLATVLADVLAELGP